MGSRNNKPGRIVKGTALQPSLKSASGVWSLDEAMQAHRANAWPQPNLFQPVANSLRLKKNSGTLPFMAKPPGRPGNLLKWTVSAWVKLGAIGTASRMELFSAGDTAAAATPANMSLMINWQGYSQDWHIAFLTGGGSYQIQTNMVLRDPSAWYHVVVVYDAAQSTDTNRVQIYINGVLASWSSTAPTGGAAVYTPQNLPLNWNNAGQIQRIGSGYDGGETYFLDGNIAEFYNIDGYALQPSLFGQLDTNNTWVPIPYTGTYGTNGFYLPFTNATTSQTLGYDASLNGTTTYDADQDPYRGNVALHLTGNGPAGGNNNVFADSSITNNSITRVGTTTQGSFSPFPLNTNTPYNPAIHGASAFFNGTADYLTLPTTVLAPLDVATGSDCTYEFWINPTALQDGGNGFYHSGNVFSKGTIYSGAQVRADGTFQHYMYDGTVRFVTTSAGAIKINTWTHVAVVLTNNTVTIYINGVSSGTGTRYALQVAAQAVKIGVGDPNYATSFWRGYISNFAVYNVAKYTAAFTPTNRPFGTLTNNLIPASEDFANTGFWAQSNVSVTPSFAVAPDGTPSATKLILTSGSSLQKRLNFTSYTPGAGTYTFSVYAKAADYNYLVVTIYESSYKGAVFNLATGVIESTLASTTTSMTSVGNGWYRISVTATTGGTLNNNATGLWPYQTLPGNAGGNATSDGNSSGGVYIWGAQFESASSPSNYVPTPANFSTAPALLLNFANAAVTDTAGTTNLLTASNATITSASKYGSGALTFSGSTDKLQMANSPQFNFGTGDFTVEAWINPTTVNVWQVIFKTSSDTSWSGGVTLALNNGVGSGVRFRVGTAFVDSATSITPNTWTHVAITRNNASCRIFLNGKLDASLSNIETADAQTTPTVGNETSGSSYPYIGLIDDLRVTKGLARYTTDFTPPARALPEVGGKSFVTTNVNAGVVQRFTTTGTTSWTAPSDVTQVEVLVVAAGGTGAADGGTNFGNGGGGGGGLIYNSAYPVTPGQTYTVTVGAGQVGLYANSQRSGGNSQFGNLIAIGGGGGGYYINNSGATGGSGGGGGATSGGAGGGTAGQGFAGGAGAANSGGGGGGAGGPASGTNSRDGGLGLQFGISGTPTYYAGGGGGSASSGAQGTGGSGSGGAAVTGGAGGVNGTANTGGGGGAQNNGGTKSGDGGSGIVIVRYTTTAVGNTSDATSDNLVDSPTQYGHDMGLGGEVVGNYATWSPLDRSPTAVLSNGNLDITPGFSTQTITRATMAVPLGQWYFEVTCRSTAGDASAGEIGFNTAAARAIDGGYTTWAVNSIYYTSTSGNKNIFGTSTAYGATWTANDIIGVAIDTVAGTIVFYKNGVSQGTITDARIISNTLFPVFANNSTTGSRNVSANFGQRAWAYAPPAGFNALTTKNLPRPTNPAIITPNQYIRALTWTGTGAAQTITAGFKPDFIWCKTRSNDSNYPILQNTVKGITYSYGSNAADAPGNYSAVSSVTSTGFVLGTSDDSNKASDSYIGYAFRAGGNSNTFNIDDVGYATASAAGLTAGTITPTGASVSTTAGFSIIKYNGDGVSPATISHGLGIAPSMIWTKVQNASDATRVWHSGFYQGNDGDGHMARLSASTAPAYDSQRSTGGTTSTFRLVGNSPGYINSVGHEFVAFVWAEIPGYSKFGTYTANASTDGPFVYCGFKPAWVMVKNITRDAGNWVVLDNALNTYNPTDFAFFTNTSARPAATYYQDFVSNGFKLRVGSGSVMNHTAGDTYIFAAYADKPFGNINGTAR